MSKEKYIRDTIGVLLLNEIYMELEQAWKSGVKLIAAANGGFRENIIPSGAILVFDG